MERNNKLTEVNMKCDTCGIETKEGFIKCVECATKAIKDIKPITEPLIMGRTYGQIARMQGRTELR